MPCCHRYEPSSSSRICALRRTMPGYGRAAATAGCSGDVLAAKASQSSAAATVQASRKRTASASASAARPVPNELLLISEMPSLAARGMSPQIP